MLPDPTVNVSENKTYPRLYNINIITTNSLKGIVYK